MVYDTDFEHNPDCPILKLETTLEKTDRKIQEYKQIRATRMQSNRGTPKPTHGRRNNKTVLLRAGSDSIRNRKTKRENNALRRGD